VTAEEEAKEFHLHVVAGARKRKADVKDPREFDDIMTCVELLGEAAAKAAKWGLKPASFGRAALYYAKCTAAYTEGGVKGLVPAEDAHV
jgi:hypothetical protein